MTRLAEALQRLHGASGSELGAVTARASASTLAPLNDAQTRLEAGGRRYRLQPLTVLDRARKGWIRSRDLSLLSAREIRMLCAEPSIATEPAFVCEIDLHPALGGQRRWLEGLLQSYWSRWRDMPDPGQLEAVLRDRLPAFTGRSQLIANCAPVARHLASPGAARWLAAEVIASRDPVSQVLAQWGVPRASRLAAAVTTEAVRQWTRRVGAPAEPLSWPDADAVARQLTDDLLAEPSSVAPAAIAEAVSALVAWPLASSEPRLRKAVVAFLVADERFGDPRLAARGRLWELVDAEAPRTVARWLANDDLLVFFNSVIGQDDLQGRRDFWLQYVERVADSNLALSTEDATRIGDIRGLRPGSSRAVGGQGTSAVLMRFRGVRDLVFVEFSRVGHTLYVYEMQDFLRRFSGIRRRWFSIESDLKDRAHALLMIPHVGNWQRELHELLAREGILPSASRERQDSPAPSR